MKKTLFLLLTAFSTSILADVAQVNIWKAYPGRMADMFDSAMKAKAIHEKNGATVSIATDQHLNMHYVAIFDTWEDWGKFSGKMLNNPEWDEYWTQALANPAAELIETLHVDNPNPSEAKAVAIIYLWDVDPGKTQEMIARATEAIGIHNALGASASINIDDIGNLHYEMSFDSWAAWGKFSAASQESEAWAEFQAKYSQPIARLAKVYRLNVMPDQ